MTCVQVEVSPNGDYVPRSKPSTKKPDPRPPAEPSSQGYSAYIIEKIKENLRVIVRSMSVAVSSSERKSSCARLSLATLRVEPASCGDVLQSVETNTSLLPDGVVACDCLARCITIEDVKVMVDEPGGICQMFY